MARLNILKPLFAGSAAILFSLSLAMPAQSHGIWFAERARQLALIYGVGADDLDAVSRMDKLTSVTGYDEDWAPVVTKLRVAGIIPVIDSDEPVAAVAAAMDYGMWTKDTNGEWHNTGRDEVPNAALSEHTMKYAVHLNKLTFKKIPLLAGHALQLIPVGTVISDKVGAPITVRAFYNGKPIAGASVMSDYVNDPDQTPVKTNADGLATIPLRNQGLNVLMAIYVGETDQPEKYDHIEYRASLSFVLPHLPE